MWHPRHADDVAAVAAVDAVAAVTVGCPDVLLILHTDHCHY